MFIALNDYYGSDVINVKMGSVQSALLLILVGKQKCIPCKGKTFSRYKRIQLFFPEFTEQNPSADFPEITFCTEMQTIK